MHRGGTLCAMIWTKVAALWHAWLPYFLPPLVRAVQKGYDRNKLRDDFISSVIIAVAIPIPCDIFYDFQLVKMSTSLNSYFLDVCFDMCMLFPTSSERSC